MSAAPYDLDAKLQELKEAEAQLTEAERAAINAEQNAILSQVEHLDAIARAKQRMDQAADAYWALKKAAEKVTP